MNKTTERALENQVKNLLIAQDQKSAQKSFENLIKLANILDSAGNEKDADRIDALVKEAMGFWESLFGGALVGGAPSIFDSITSGKGGLDKETLVPIVKKMMMGAVAAMITNAILGYLENVPVLGGIVKSQMVQAVIEGAASYAITHSNFADMLVDQLIDGVKGMFGMGGSKTSPTEVKPDIKPTIPGATTKTE